MPSGPPPSGAPLQQAPLQAQNSGPIRVPPLTPDKVAQYTKLFEESGPQNGTLSGDSAKYIFERAQLPNEVLGRIWTLVDTEQKGALGLTEFIVGIHLLTSMKNGSMRAVPQVLPPGLYDAAARRGGPLRQQQQPSSRPTSGAGQLPAGLNRQFTGSPALGQQQQPSRTASSAFGPPQGASDSWLVSPQDKTQFDSIFRTVDTQNRGLITGDQAVGFFSNSRLPEEALAQIWDLADINSEGQLTADEFAVAMYLIRQQRSKTTERDVLPQQLPPNLIPPSMRRQPIAPQQPTAPAFDNAANTTAPRSASEDLFGLDAITSSPPPAAAPLQAKSTGDSSTYATPPRRQASPTPPSAPASGQAASHFKPFVPSSSFGQTIMTPQGTGTSGSTSPGLARNFPGQQKQPAAMEDLLGDNDPEVSKKLTSDSSDLGNLSSQVGTLTGQMQDLKTKRGNTEQELGQAGNQKRQFEARLAELRAAYEQEVKEVRALEERLTSSRNESKKLQSDMAMISGTHEDLQTQHRQVGEALAADQNENGSLKERIRMASSEIEQIKPQLEKLRSDARHQKGLVAINKKQLATHQAEHEKIKADMNNHAEEHAQALRDLEQSQRDVEAAAQTKRELEETASQARAPPAAAAATAAPAAVPAPTVASPAPSTASMNPFFRRPTNPDTGSAFSPFTPANASSPSQNAFDSFFGPPAATSTPPQTSFRSESPGVQRQAMPGQAASNQSSSEEPGMATPPASPPPLSNFSESPTGTEPPAPPQSRQITSSFLPFRPPANRSESENSSVKVAPPASRMGDISEAPTPAPTDAPVPASPKQHFRDMASTGPIEPSPLTQPPAQEPSDITAQEAALPENTSQTAGMPSASRDVPGAFPGDETPFEKPETQAFAPNPYSGAPLDPRVDAAPQSRGPSAGQPPHLQPGASDPFAKSSTPTSVKDDFDSAFESFGSDKGKAAEQPAGQTADDPFGYSALVGQAPQQQTPQGQTPPGQTPQGQAGGEFPPIKELEPDDDSESESDRGFDDDFTTRSANKTTESGPNEALQGQALTVGAAGLTPSRPAFNTVESNRSQLPTPGAQSSPPPYEGGVFAGATGDRKGSNQFPAEYSGLLPSRDDPMSPPTLSTESSMDQKSNVASSAGIDRGLNFFPEPSSSRPAPSDQTTAAQQSSFSQMHAPMATGASNNAPFAFSQTASSPPPTIPQPTPQQAPSLPPKPSAPKDDFDDFEDLAPAQEEDATNDDPTFNFHSSRSNNNINNNINNNDDLDFNPTFDSPQTSQHGLGGASQSSSVFPPPLSTSERAGDNIFSGFEPSNSTSGAGPAPPRSQQQAQQPISHDWDAIFAGLDNPSSTNEANATKAPEVPARPNGTSAGALDGGLKMGENGLVQSGAEDDDPILKRLIGMGFAREESLGALEKYDYNIDKVRSPAAGLKS